MPFSREDERHFQSNTLELLTSKEQPPGFVAGVLTTGEGLDGEPLPCITHDKVKREVQKIEEGELQQGKNLEPNSTDLGGKQQHNYIFIIYSLLLEVTIASEVLPRSKFP